MIVDFSTVEPFKEDPPIWTKLNSQILFPTLNIMQLEPLKEDNLYIGENPLKFILVPKCTLLVGFTVYR